MSIPQTGEARKLVLDRVQKCVQLLKEIDTHKEDIAGYKEEVCERYDIKKTEFQKIVKAAYDKAKVEEQIEELETSLSELEILLNGSNEEEESE